PAISTLSLHDALPIFADESQHLRAIIEVPRQLEMTHRALGRGGRLLGIEQDRGILGELVHVDDVRQRTQPMQRVEHALALDALLDRKSTRLNSSHVKI